MSDIAKLAPATFQWKSPDILNDPAVADKEVPDNFVYDIEMGKSTPYLVDPDIQS